MKNPTIQAKKNAIEELRVLYPNVKFTLTSVRINQPCEDAFYPHGGEPKASRESGTFLRMQNVCGGADTLRLSSDKIHSLADWHNQRRNPKVPFRTIVV